MLKRGEAWRAAHRRLYEHLCATTPDKPQPTLEDLQPLYQAVAHGCQAGLQQEAAEKVYFARITHRSVFYSTKKLGAYGSDLGAVACFFERPWSRVSLALTHFYQAWMLNNAAVFLQELGRPIEALEPMQLGLEMRVQQENWKQAAINTINLSHLDLTLGEVGEAVRDAEQSVIYAERSGDAEEGVITRTTYADALHQAGRWVEAETRFSEAEAIIAKSLPGQLFLFSVSGFRYCDLLLTAPERAAWQTMQKSEPRSQRSTLIEGCHTVSQRAAQTLKLAEQYSYDILSIALDHLTLGRAALCVEILEDSDLRRSISDIEHIDTSVDGLRRSGSVNDLPRGLLTRAWMRFLTGARTGPESAQRDLDEAWEIAERGPPCRCTWRIFICTGRDSFSAKRIIRGSRRRRISPRRGG